MSGSEMTNVGGVDGGGMQNPPTGSPQPVTQNIPVVAVSEVSTPVAGIGSGRGNGSGRGRGRGNGGDNGTGRGRGRGRGNGNGEKRRGRPRKYGSETSTMAIPLSCAPPGATIATPLPQQHQRIQYRQLPPYHLLQQHQQRQNLQQQEQPQTAPQLQQQPTQPPIQEQQQPPLPQHPPVQQQPPLREEQQPSLPPLQEVHLQPPLPQQLLQEEERQQQQQPQQEEQQPTMPQQQQQQGGGSQRKVRRRPRGGGRVRQGNPAICGLVGEVFIVNTGEDVSSRILALTQSGASLIFIISAIGSISNATIRAVLPGDSSKTYEGRFDIMSLSGSFRLSDGSGPRNWAGGITVSLTDPDGRVLGGGVAGLLTAASPVQVAVAYNMGDGVAESARPLAVAGPAGPRSSPSHGNLSESAGVAGSPFNQSARAADSTPDPITISDSP